MPSACGPLARLRSRYREVGPANAALLGLNCLLQSVHPRLAVARYHLMAQPVPEAPLLRGRERSLVVRSLRPDDPALARRRPGPDRRPEERRLHEDAYCLGAFRPGEERLLGFIRLLSGAHREDEHRCLLRPPADPRCVLDVDVYVFPHARGGFVFAHLWDAANAWLRRQGVEWTLSRISAFNANSLRAHQRLGAQRVGDLYFLQMGALEILLTGQRPFVAVSRPRGRPPEITIHPPGPGLQP